MSPSTASGVGTLFDAGKYSTSGEVNVGCVVYFLIFAVYASSTGCLGSRDGAVSPSARTIGAHRSAKAQSSSEASKERFMSCLQERNQEFYRILDARTPPSTVRQFVSGDMQPLGASGGAGILPARAKFFTLSACLAFVSAVADRFLTGRPKAQSTLYRFGSVDQIL